MGLVPESARIAGGSIIFEGSDLLKLSEAEMRGVRGARIAMIFQEPMTSLNPVFTIGSQIGEAIKLHQHTTRHETRNRTIEALRMVGIADPERRIRDYPHQLSGVMRQAPTAALFANPLSPYTKGLLGSIPGIDGTRHRRLEAIPGFIPGPLNPPSGCRFHPRCPIAIDDCARVE